ncbi:MAG TPA: HAMP domain-containing sensor histidine kinase [Burkholderiaceae bacterium]
MNPTIPFYNPSPLVGPTGAATFVLILFIVFFFGMWWKDRDPGAQWIALSIWVSATFYGAESLGRVGPPSAHMGPAWAVVTLAVGVILLVVGLCMFVDPARWKRRRSTYVAMAPMLLLILLMVLQVRVPRVAGNWLWILPYMVLSFVVWRARKTEPGAGYPLLAASLLILPIGLPTLVALGLDVVFLRYLSLLSRILVAMTLLVIFMHRRRERLENELVRRRAAEQELIAANALLERRVAERTADLQNVVTGLESFNRNVSHDLRGPLGGIAGLSHIAVDCLEQGEVDKVKRMLALIEQQARKSTDLVTALLELARIGHAPVERSLVPVGELVGSVVKELELLPQASVAPAVHVAALPEVQADPRLVRVVYTNLLSNAYKFLGGRAQPRVDIGVEERDGQPLFFVRDNGPGFDAKVAATLFEPFQRFHGAAFAGHGVGLSIVRRAIERHGGRIWAEARPEGGACFFFTLGGPA